MTLVSPSGTGPVDVTVFIPTFNGETYLERLLTAVENQDFTGQFEILIIDSGSTDATLEIIARHPFVRLVRIPQSDFGHGKTRNDAARQARGRVVAYLSHDALPADESWLRHLVEPLSASSKPRRGDCVAVFGRQVARSTCFPSLKYEIDGIFAACGPDDVVTMVRCEPGNADALSAAELFYSDVNSAARRDILTGTIPYRDVPYSEDLFFARDVLNAGYAKAYAPQATVEHSNDVTLAEYGPRVFDETIGRRRLALAQDDVSPNVGGESSPTTIPSALGILVRWLRDVLRTDWRIMRDRDFSLGRKLRWVLVNPSYLWGKWINIRRGLRVDLGDTNALERYSREARAKHPRS